MTAKLLPARDPVLSASRSGAPKPGAPKPGAPRPGTLEPGPAAGTSLLFLREEQIRLTQDLLFLAYRDFTASADIELERIGLGRAHHRALHFIARRPGISVSELLGLLRITKQSLARVLGELVARGYVMQETGRRDRRQRLLSLTESGGALERLLFERQREVVAGAYREAGGAAVEGFRKVMRALMDSRSRALLDGRPAPDLSR